MDCFFIHIPKCAGHSVRKAITGKSFEWQHQTPVCYRKHFGARFDAGFKFVVVRHPYDRWVSAYYYLMQHTKESPAWRSNRDDQAFLQQFPSMEAALLQAGKKLKETVLVFHPLSRWFEPPIVYDLVLRHEHLERDWPWLMQRFGFKPLPLLNTSQHVPADELLTAPMRAELQRLYAEDFTLFGWPI